MESYPGDMSTPVKPIEQKRLLGNPGGRKLPEPGSLVALPGGYREPLRELGEAGLALWDAVYANGGIAWVSSRTDVVFLQMVCEQLDRREWMREQLAADPDWHVMKQLNDLEKLIQVNLGQLGFTPAERSRLGVAEVKAQSKLEELQERRAARG